MRDVCEIHEIISDVSLALFITVSIPNEISLGIKAQFKPFITFIALIINVPETV
jgi:hypothetical protein